MNQPTGMTCVNLAPQSLDIHLDQIREWIKGFIPYVLGNLGTCNKFTRAAAEVLQQRILFCGQLHVGTRTSHSSGDNVDCQIIDFDIVEVLGWPAAEQRTDSRKQ